MKIVSKDFRVRPGKKVRPKEWQQGQSQRGSARTHSNKQSTEAPSTTA